MDDPNCYDKQSEYWAGQSADVDGMLGGLSHVSNTDISFSTRFFEQVRRKGYVTEAGLAVDVGAGIGRISKHFLSKHFEKVDLLEADEHFLAAAPEYIGETVMKKVRKVIPLRLQNFQPEPESYDCIWIQWVLSHLRDDDLLISFGRLKAALRTTSNGVIFVKENLAKSEDEFDEVDSSVTRSRETFLKLFKQAGLTVIKEAKQMPFPKNLYEVRLFCLQ